MSDSDGTPPNGWNQLHPLHPSNLRPVESDAARMFDRLVVRYGTVIAHRIWDQAAARYSRPKAKGRPKGSRTRDHWLNEIDAHRTLHAVANDPANAGLTRWQVFDRAATALDAGNQQDTRNKADAMRRSLQADPVIGCSAQALESHTPTFEQWAASQPRLSPKQRKDQKRRISAIRRLLERLQADIDIQRRMISQWYDKSEASIEEDEILSPRAKSLKAQTRSNALAALPPLPQEGGSPRGNGTKRAGKKSLYTPFTR